MNAHVETQARANLGEGLFATLTRRFGQVVESTKAAVAHSRARRRAIAELSALSDRNLLDVGLHRAQIREVVDASLMRQAEAETGKAAPEQGGVHARGLFHA